MINKTLHKYRLLKVKNQIISDLILSVSFYCILIIFCILSEIVFYHPENIRYKFFVLLTVIPIILAGYIIIKAMINLQKINDNMSDEALAKELGYKVPKLADKILNALQLSKRTFENKIKATLSNQAIKSVEDAIKKKNLKILAPKISKFKILTIVFILSITLLFILTSYEGNNSLKRIYSYNQLFNPPIPFKIKSNQKTAEEYPSGENVSISFTIEGEISPSHIMLHWINNNKHDSLLLNFDKGFYNHKFYNLQSNYVYWASYNSKTFFSRWDTIGTKPNNIKVIKRPEIENIEFELQYPNYTLQKNKKIKGNTAQISAIRGSNLICKLKSNQPLSSAKIITDSNDALNFKINKYDEWSTILNLNNTEMIEIEIYNEKKLKNEIPLFYKIKTTDDLRPEIYMINPRQKTFEINDQSNIDISFKASDDYGLKRAWIEYEIIKSNEINIDSSYYSILLNQYSNIKNYEELYTWKLDSYNLFPGDQIKFRIAAQDNNPMESITKTDYYYAIYPSFENIFSNLEKREDEVKDISSDIMNQIDELDNTIQDMELDLLKASNVDWQQQQQAEESIKKMDELFNDIDKMQEAIEKLQEQAEKSDKIDDKLAQKFEQFQDMLESIMTPELMEALQKMQEALKNMNLEEMLEATKNLDYNLEQFEQQIERFIEMFELAIAEQKLNELVEALEMMAEKQDAIQQKFNENSDLKNITSMQKQQNQNFADLQKIMGEAKQNIEKFSEQTTKEIENLMMSDINKDTEQSLELAEKKLSVEDMTAINEIDKSKDNLQSMHEMVKNIKNNFDQEQVGEMVEIFYSAIRNILKLSEYQENLSFSFEKIRSSNPKLKPLTFEQFIISKQFINFINQLMELSTKTFYITPAINRKIGACKKTIDNSIINLEQRRIKTAQSEQKKILSSMNEIALLLINAMDEMQDSGSASGLESYMEQLEKISDGQSEINMGTMQLGQMGMMSQQEMMKRLEAQQKSLKEQLEQILNECSGSGSEEHEGLSKAAKDMEDIIRDFQQNKISRETKEKQQKILSRLLNSQKSLKEREFSDKRKSETGESKKYAGALDMPKNLGNNNLLFIDAMEEALDQNYSNEYKAMFRKYYRELQQDEETTK